MVRGLCAVMQAVVPQGDWGAFGDGHKTSLVSLIGANTSPSIADAVTLLPGACKSCKSSKSYKSSKSAAAATSADVALDLYPQLPPFPGVITT